MTGTVPCRFCDQPTRMTSTKLCDGCWEVSSRIRRFIDLPRGRAHVEELLGATAPEIMPMAARIAADIRAGTFVGKSPPAPGADVRRCRALPWCGRFTTGGDLWCPQCKGKEQP